MDIMKHTFQYRYLQGTGREPDDRNFDFAGPFAQVEEGTIEAQSEENAADQLFHRHNRDDRPRGREIRSMSTGDIIAFDTGVALRCMMVGWVKTEVPSWPKAGGVTEAQAQAIIDTGEGA